MGHICPKSPTKIFLESTSVMVLLFSDLAIFFMLEKKYRLYLKNKRFYTLYFNVNLPY